MKEQDNLIYDDGELRRCPSNFVKLGVIKTAYKFFWYGHVFRDMKFAYVDSFKEAVAFLINLLVLPFVIVALPVIPFIRAYAAIAKAKGE